MEGVVKYQQHFTPDAPMAWEKLRELDHYRSMLHQQKLIAAYADGIGYGNISIKLDDGSMAISGSQTGHLARLSAEHYACVTKADIQQNTLWSKGPVQASSESLTHAAIYEIDDKIQAVMHIHHLALWQKYLQRLPSTSAEVHYGTPEMAVAVQQLYKNDDWQKCPVIIMGGHEEGIITFGRDLAEAYHWIEKLVHERI